MRLDIPLNQLANYCQASINGPCSFHDLKIQVLEGGYVSKGVYRLTVTMDSPGGESQEVSFVQKIASAAEVNLMVSLNQSIPSEALPWVVASFVDPESPSDSWFITPFYSGPALTWDEAVPDEVLKLLARMHTIYENKVEAFNHLYLVDENLLSRIIDQIEAALTEIKPHLMGDSLEDVERKLATTQTNSQLKDALKQLPLTLTHGDVHPGNLIKKENGQIVLIDWGNARRAPAALDLANMVRLDSPQWRLYLDFCDEALGKPVDRRLAVLGYHWATVQINLNYLPFAIANRPIEAVLEMIEKIMAAQSRIELCLQ